jgi:hypothetical protein
MLGAVARLKIVTVPERPEIAAPAWELTSDTMPEYNNHGDVLNHYWPRLAAELPDFQFHLLDGENIVARARSIPFGGTVRSAICRPGSTAQSHAASTRAARTCSVRS